MKYILIILSIVLFGACSIAQPGYSTKSKKAIKLFEAGKEAPSLTIDYETNTPNFKAGLELLNKAIEKDPNFWEAHLLAGEFAEYIYNYPLAISHYKRALEINPRHSRTGSTVFFLANAQHAVGDYEDAIRNIDIFQQNRNANPDLLIEASKIREKAVFAKESLEKDLINPSNYKPINIGKGINTKNPEYFPTITVDGKTLLFTRRLPDGRVEGPIKEQEDFFVSQLNENNFWGEAIAMPSNVNTVFNEGAPTISADGRSLIFIACEDELADLKYDEFGRKIYQYGENRTGYGSCDLFITKKIGPQWTNPQNLPGNINTYDWETQPSLSSDGKTMYFIRRVRKNNPTRDSDIFMSRKDENGNWGIAERLPDHINTNQMEESVLIHPDGRTLYFASRGHVGMGGSDLFISRMDAQGNWGKPENLGYPINTKYDENSLMVAADGEIAFFASDREEIGAQGGLDIYYFIMPEHLRPTKTLYFDGFVYDIETKNPVAGKFQLIDIKTGKEVIYSEADKLTGEFMVALPVNREYALNVSYPGYAFFSQNFNMTNPEGLEAVHMDVPLVPFSSDKPILLANVFFDLAKATLRPNSFVELDKLASFLKENKEIIVEIGGHTDSRGSNNQILSDKRAKAVYDYLLTKGIEEKQLTHKGYGSTQTIFTDEYISNLVTKEKKEEAHQSNRRTEYKIISE